MSNYLYTAGRGEITFLCDGIVVGVGSVLGDMVVSDLFLIVTFV